MTEVVKFKADHAFQINMQDHDLVELSSFKREHFEAMASRRHSYTILVNGVVRACIGLVEYWNNRGELWAIIDRSVKHEFVSIVRAMKRLLDESDVARMEAIVNVGFVQGHRLVKLLGFELEAPLMRKYGVTGLDCSLYARVK